MRVTLMDHELTLPARWPRRIGCANKFCDHTVRITGEFCKDCLRSQAQMRAEWKRTHAKG